VAACFERCGSWSLSGCGFGAPYTEHYVYMYDEGTDSRQKFYNCPVAALDFGSVC
jgi:hypothetical protein